MDPLSDLVQRAKGGDVRAFGHIVDATQRTAYAAAWSVLRDGGLAEDAAQQAYLRAFRRLGDLQDPAAFPAWLRRIVITVALNLKRSQRMTFLRLDDVPELPVLDDAESRWSETQRHRLSSALLTLTADERRWCDRRYHGHWSTARLAAAAGMDEAAMRKRLQRIRHKLRKEMEMMEAKDVPASVRRPDLPGKVIELLARPQLTDLPENPVGRILESLRAVFPEFDERALPEIVDLADAAKTIATDAMYVDPVELHRIDDRHILRYDLTLPLLLNVRVEHEPLRIWTSGKAYRVCQTDATHLEAFHQAEVFWLDEHDQIDPWRWTGRVLQSADRVLPGRTVKIVPTVYPMCKQAWELAIEEDGQWFEILAWGIFTDRIVSHMGGDPRRHTAAGAGYGLERLAMHRYGIDDIRKIEVASVA